MSLMILAQRGLGNNVRSGRPFYEHLVWAWFSRVWWTQMGAGYALLSYFPWWAWVFGCIPCEGEPNRVEMCLLSFIWAPRRHHDIPEALLQSSRGEDERPRQAHRLPNVRGGLVWPDTSPTSSFTTDVYRYEFGGRSFLTALCTGHFILFILFYYLFDLIWFCFIFCLGSVNL